VEQHKLISRQKNITASTSSFIPSLIPAKKVGLSNHYGNSTAATSATVGTSSCNSVSAVVKKESFEEAKIKRELKEKSRLLEEKVL